MSRPSLKSFVITALLQLIPKVAAAPEITCDPNPRTFYMTNKQYGDPNLDLEGKLFPRMAKLLCDERFCPPQGRPTCSYSVQPYLRNIITYTWDRPDSLDTACHISNFEAIVEKCFNANPPSLGGTYRVNERESYSISIAGFEGVDTMIGDVVGSHPPIWPPQADEPVNQPPADEPATFYVADYRQPPNAEGQTGVSVYGIHHGDCDWLVKGNGPNANPEDLSTNIKLRDFAADVNDVALGSGQQLPAFYYYHDELPKFNGFTLRGRRKGVCGLDAVFEFKKVQDGKFSFTDKGPGGPITGYCNVVTSDSEKHKQMCVGKDGDNLGHTINIEEVLACYAPGNPTYCTNYGKP